MGPHTPPADRLAGFARFIARNPKRLRDTLQLTLDYAQQQPGDPLVHRVLDGYRQPLAEALGPKQGDLALSLILGMLVQQLLAGTADVSEHLGALALFAR